MKHDELFRDDIIYAPATSLASNSALAIFRISGKGSLGLLNRLLSPPPAKIVSWQIKMGRLVDCNGSTIDNILYTVYKAPNSYTGEDMIELFVHGGEIIPEILSGTLEKLGARIAENGEFTKRAFINGKISLIDAEAINAIINAKSYGALISAQRSLESDEIRKLATFSDTLNSLRIELLAKLEFPEDISEVIPTEELLKALTEIIGLTDYVIERAQTIESKQAFRAVLYGKTNVGKSSIFNALLKKDRAIVHHEPGTTRDFIEAVIRLGDTSFTLYDTAGINITEDDVEQNGIMRTRELIDNADVILYVIDSTSDIYETDSFDDEKKIVYLLNKIDISTSDTWKSNLPSDVIELSAIGNIGLDALLNEIQKIVRQSTMEDELILSGRCIGFLRELRDSSLKAKEAVSDGLYDIVAVQMENAIDSIEKATGKTYNKDIQIEIFSKFCIGK